MYRKHLENIAVVSIKLIFNFDDDLSNHSYFIVLSVIGYLKLLIVAFFSHTASLAQDGHTAVTGFVEHISRKREAENEHQGLLLNINNSKHNFLQKDIWQWRMK